MMGGGSVVRWVRLPLREHAVGCYYCGGDDDEVERMREA